MYYEMYLEALACDLADESRVKHVAILHYIIKQHL